MHVRILGNTTESIITNRMGICAKVDEPMISFQSYPN